MSLAVFAKLKKKKRIFKVHINYKIVIVELKVCSPEKQNRTLKVKTTSEAIIIAKKMYNISLLDEIYMQMFKELSRDVKNSQ